MKRNAEVRLKESGSLSLMIGNALRESTLKSILLSIQKGGL
jgi:hypothetical protein